MRFSRHSALLVCVSTSPTVAAAFVLRGQQHDRLDAWGSSAVLEDMRPEIVANLFRGVEHSWLEDQAAALTGTTDASEIDLETYAKTSMVKSCSKVANSIVQGSSGEERRVAEYMGLVCKRLKVDGEAHSMCAEFGQGIVDFMRGDAMFNRNELNLNQFCEKFYEASVKPAAARMQAEEEKEAQSTEKTTTSLPPPAPVTTMAHVAPVTTMSASVKVVTAPPSHQFGSRLSAKEDVAADAAEEKVIVHVTPQAKKSIEAAKETIEAAKKSIAAATTTETSVEVPTVAAALKPEPVAKRQEAAAANPATPHSDDEEEEARMLAAMPGH